MHKLSLWIVPKPFFPNCITCTAIYRFIFFPFILYFLLTLPLKSRLFDHTFYANVYTMYNAVLLFVFVIEYKKIKF